MVVVLRLRPATAVVPAVRFLRAATLLVIEHPAFSTRLMVFSAVAAVFPAFTAAFLYRVATAFTAVLVVLPWQNFFFAVCKARYARALGLFSPFPTLDVVFLGVGISLAI